MAQNQPDERTDEYWSLDAATLLAQLASTPAGLAGAEAQRRLARDGANRLEQHEHVGLFSILLRQAASPLVLIVLLAALVSAALKEWTDCWVLMGIIVVSVVLSTLQEYRADRAISLLRRRLARTVMALRDGVLQRVPADQLVGGDVVELSAGSLVAADGLVLEAEACTVDESVLTGESLPVEKSVATVAAAAPLPERRNCLHAGTLVQSGRARLLVVKTGAHTAVGTIAASLARRHPESAFERGIRRFGLMLTQVMMVLVVLVFAANVLFDRPVTDALLFAIALAVGISPELLPAIIGLNLAGAAQTMAGRGVLVRRLNAIENLGSMDVLCTDKTGTLTEGKIRLEAVRGTDGASETSVRSLAVTAAFAPSQANNVMDQALRAIEPEQRPTILAELPFDFARRRVSVVIERDGRRLLICKGALEPLLEVCTRIRLAGGDEVLHEADIRQLRAELEQAGAAGRRLIGVAVREVPQQSDYALSFERELTFVGSLAFADALKPDAASAVEQLRNCAVRVKIISGDNRFVTAHVAAAAGIGAEPAVTGADLDRMSEARLAHTVRHRDVFAEIEPHQKERVLQALKRSGHIVGFLGDGVNDTPALHIADVGISVDQACDAAREAADIVLLRSDLAQVAHGIGLGRQTFANTLKYIYTTTSANFGNMLSMAVASLGLPFLPLLAKQILLNNILSDIPAFALANDRVDEQELSTPPRWQVAKMLRFMVVFGLISSLIDLLSFWLLVTPLAVTLEEFRTFWFVESLMTELLVVFLVRTRRPVWRSRPSALLLLSSGATAVAAIWLPTSPWATAFGFVPLSLQLWLIMLGLIAVYGTLTEIAKRRFFRRESIAQLQPSP